MSLLDQLYAEDNDNSLEIMLGISPSPSESSPLLFPPTEEAEEKQISVTYNWIWNDEEPMLSQEPEEAEDKSIYDMKSARAEQEEKVRQFVAKLKPLEIMHRKVSMEDKTQLGSPKKKKIRKMVSMK